MISKISKGRQVTIPSQYRQKYGFKVGSRIDIKDTGKGVLLTPLESESWDKIFEEGQKYPNNLSDKEMDLLEEQIYE